MSRPIRPQFANELTPPRDADKAGSRTSSDADSSDVSSKTLISLGLFLLIGFCWSYWPTLNELRRIWDREPDYSHGYLVFPIAVAYLWSFRQSRPAIRLHWIGLPWIALSIVVRYFGERFAIDSLDGYSMLVWFGGVALLLGGVPMLKWAVPAIGFLFFMVPLPFRIEVTLSQQLQTVATAISSFLLQILGQPAFAEGKTILLGDQQLRIEQACSGMRIFFGTFALAYAYIIFTRPDFWEAVVLVLCAAPIALIVNSLRIVGTGLLFQHFSDQAARRFSHDVAGWVMIPFAALLFGAVVFYLRRLVRETESLDLSELVDLKRSDT